MTIDEAIQKLEIAANDLMTPLHYEFVDAIRLGIEALLAVKQYRSNPHAHQVYRLDGETIE